MKLDLPCVMHRAELEKGPQPERLDLDMQEFIEAIEAALPGAEVYPCGTDVAWLFARKGDNQAVMKLRYKNHSRGYNKDDYKYTIYSRTIVNEKHSYGNERHQRATKNLKQAVKNVRKHLTPLALGDYLRGSINHFTNKFQVEEGRHPKIKQQAWAGLTGTHGYIGGVVTLVETMMRLDDDTLRDAGLPTDHITALREFEALHKQAVPLTDHNLWFVCPRKNDVAVTPMGFTADTAHPSVGVRVEDTLYYRSEEVPQAIQDTMATLAIMPEGTYAPQVGMRVPGGAYVFTRQAG